MVSIGADDRVTGCSFHTDRGWLALWEAKPTSMIFINSFNTSPGTTPLDLTSNKKINKVIYELLVSIWGGYKGTRCSVQKNN